MTQMILYDCSTAPSPRRARILLAEKGVPHDTVQVACARGSSSARRSDASIRIAPCRLYVPTTACC